MIHRPQSGTGPSLSSEISKSTATVAHFFQQGHKYSNNATPPSSAAPMGQSLKHISLWQSFLFKPPYKILIYNKSQRKKVNTTLTWDVLTGEVVISSRCSALTFRFRNNDSTPSCPFISGVKNAKQVLILNPVKEQYKTT